MKKYLHALAMCRSMFCAIPCFWRVWDEKARDKMLLFLPVVGLEIGAIWALLAWLCRYLALPALVQGAVLGAYPFVVTGFIHLDGFMDVTDAVRSQAPKASIEERDDYGQCLTSLLIGDVDAVAAGDAILTGLATVKGNGYVQVVGAPFGEERYGIAVKHGNTQLADSIDDILSDMIDDGTWRQAVRGMRRQIGYTVDSKLNPPDPAASSDPEQGAE